MHTTDMEMTECDTQVYIYKKISDIVASIIVIISNLLIFLRKKCVLVIFLLLLPTLPTCSFSYTFVLIFPFRSWLWHVGFSGSSSSDFTEMPGFTFTFRSPDEVFREFFGGQDPFASFFGKSNIYWGGVHLLLVQELILTFIYSV